MKSNKKIILSTIGTALAVGTVTTVVPLVSSNSNLAVNKDAQISNKQKTTLSTYTFTCFKKELPSEPTDAELAKAILDLLTNKLYNTSVEITQKTPNNRSGTCNISFIVHNAQDENGRPFDDRYGYIDFWGFMSQQETTIEPGRLDGMEDTLAQNADWYAIKNRIYFQHLVKNSWKDMMVQSQDIQVVIVGHDNVKGTVTCNVTILNWRAADSNGNQVQSKAFSNVTFSGFKTMTPTKYEVASVTCTGCGLKLCDPNIILTSEHVKKSIMWAINSPDYHFETSDIDILEVVNSDPLHGTATVNVNVKNGWINDKGEWEANHKLPGVKLTDFDIATPSSIKTDGINCSAANINVLNKDKIINSNEVKQAIINNTSNLYDSITTDDITINDVTNQEPLNGNVTVSVTVKKNWINAAGYLESDTQVRDIRLTNFVKTHESSIVTDGVDCSSAHMTVIDKEAMKNSPEVKQAIAGAITNGLGGLSASDIEIQNVVSTQPLAGTATVAVNVKNNWIGGNGFVDQNHLITELKLKGFQQTTPSKIKRDGIDCSRANITAVNEQEIMNSSAIQTIISEAITDPYKPISGSDIEIQNVLSQHPLDGTATVTITVRKNWVDDKGFVLTNYVIQDIQLTGFVKTKPSTIVESGIDCHLANMNVVDSNSIINNNDIKNAIIRSISNSFDTLTTDDIQINNVVSAKPLEGSAIVNVTIKKNWVNDEGFIQLNHNIPNLLLTSFNRTSPSTFDLNQLIDCTSARIGVTNDIKFDNTVKGLIAGAVVNPSKNLSANDVTITQITESNPSKGTATVNASINNCYLDTGFVGTKEVEGIKLAGFITNGTTALSSDSFPIVGQEETPASDFIKTESNLEILKEQVKHAITGLRTQRVDSSLIPQDIEAQNSDITLTNLTPLDGSGKLTATATLSSRIAWKNGSPSDMPFNVTFTRFKKLQTSVISGGTFNYGDTTRIPSECVNDKESIKAIVANNFENMFINIPPKFDKNNTNQYTISEVVPNDKNGSLSFKLSVQGVFGPDDSTQINDIPITFTNYKRQITTWNEGEYNLGDGTKVSNNSSINGEWIRNKVINNIDLIASNLPKDWRADADNNVEIIPGSISSDPKYGKLKFMLKLNNVYPADGSSSMQKEVTFTGFKIPLTTWVQADNNYVVGDSNVFANDVSSDQVKQAIVSNIKNIITETPPGWTASTDKITINGDLKVNNEEGKITTDVTISGVYGPDYTDSIRNTIVLTGYKSRITSWKTFELSIGNSSMVASEKAKDIAWLKSQVNDNLSNLVNNIPAGYSDSSILIQGQPRYDDHKGEIYANVRLNNVYLTSGETYIEHEIKFTGFEQKSTSLSSNTMFTWGDQFGGSAKSVTVEQLTAKVWQNINLIFKDVPPTATIDSIKLQDIHRDVGAGRITFNVILSKTYQDKIISSRTISVSGFAPLVTAWVSNSVSIGDNKIYSNNDIITIDYVKELVKENIGDFAVDLPDNYDFGKNLIISNLTTGRTDNSLLLSGKITFDVTLNGIYNPSADKSIKRTFTMTGFKTTGTTTQVNTSASVTLDNVKASNATIEQIKQQIIAGDIITGLANGQKLTPDDFDVEIVSTNNDNGTVTINIKLSNGLAWENGKVTKEEKSFQGIVIGGFNKVDPQVKWWVWASISGVGVLLIFLIVLIILIAKKKKLSKDIKTNRSAVVAPKRLSASDTPSTIKTKSNTITESTTKTVITKSTGTTTPTTEATTTGTIPTKTTAGTIPTKTASPTLKTTTTTTTTVKKD